MLRNRRDSGSSTWPVKSAAETDRCSRLFSGLSSAVRPPPTPSGRMRVLSPVCPMTGCRHSAVIPGQSGTYTEIHVHRMVVKVGCHTDYLM